MDNFSHKMILLTFSHQPLHGSGLSKCNEWDIYPMLSLKTID